MRKRNSKSSGAQGTSLKDTKKKNTKWALVSSMLALVLCCAMLIGTTFAWFTDSVTSGRNKIVAGNLDVELEYWDGQDYVSAEKVALFSEDTFWEPGHVEVVYLKVSNKGSLALKYQLSTIDTFEYQFSKNSAGETILLSDYLEIGVVEKKNAAEGTFQTREDAVNSITDSVSYDEYTKASTLLPESADYLAVVVYMPETVGNEANWDSTITGSRGAPWIRFSLGLVATQVESESDSFGNTYDEGLVYPIAGADAAATGTVLYNELETENPNIMLGSDADRYYGWFVRYATTLNLNGNTLSTTGQNPVLTVDNGADLTITGSGTVDASGSTRDGIAVDVETGGKVTIESGTFIGCSGCSCIYNNGGEIIITGGFFMCEESYDSTYFVLNQKDNSTGTISVRGGTFVNCDPSKTGTEPAGQNDNFVAEGYKVISETQTNGDIWYTVVPE